MTPTETPGVVGLVLRALAALFVIVWLGRSLLILAALLAVAGAVVAVLAVGVWALLVRRRGW